MHLDRPRIAVISTMTVAMTLSSLMALLPVVAADLVPDPTVMTVLMHGMSLFFALYAGGALLVTRRHHGVRVTSRVAGTAVLSISASFPVLWWGGGLLGCSIAAVFEAKRAPTAEWIAIIGAMTLASALGARWVCATLARLTGHTARRLRTAMVAWGAAWPFVVLLVQHVAKPLLVHGSTGWRMFYDFLSPGCVLAWQLPIGLACGEWFIRAGRRATLPENALPADRRAPARLAR